MAVKKEDLERVIDRLNSTLGLKRTYVKSTASYKGKALALSGAYGGWKLVLVGKGERNISVDGFVSKKELYITLVDMENGINLYKHRKQLKK